MCNQSLLLLLLLCIGKNFDKLQEKVTKTARLSLETWLTCKRRQVLHSLLSCSGGFYGLLSSFTVAIRCSAQLPHSLVSPVGALLLEHGRLLQGLSSNVTQLLTVSAHTCSSHTLLFTCAVWSAGQLRVSQYPY